MPLNNKIKRIAACNITSLTSTLQSTLLLPTLAQGSSTVLAFDTFTSCKRDYATAQYVVGLRSPDMHVIM